MQSKALKVVAGAMAIVLVPLLFLSSDRKPWESSNFFTLLVQEVSYPIEYVWHASLSYVSTSWGHYVDLVNASSENETLRAEIAELKARTIDYEEQSLEVARLRRLMGFAEHYDKELMVAEIVGAPTLAPFYSLRVSRGSLHGVELGMPVVTADGIVGKVIRTGLAFSDAQLLTDTNFHLDVLLQRTRVRGVIQGQGGGKCALRLHRRAEIRIGDTVITSGIVGGFPKGLPVGRVVRISYENDDVSQVVTVEPWVDYRRVDEAFILKTFDKELQKIIDTAGNAWLQKTVNTTNGG